MYTSPDDARSDLFLSGAVYLFGPLILDIVLRLVPLYRVPGVGEVLIVGLPLATTVLVPLLLIRYRGESLRSYGFGGSVAGAVPGLLVAVPLVVASALAVLLRGGDILVAFPVTASAGALGLLARTTTWFGLAGLGVYAAVKARDAFRSDYRTVREGLTELGRIVVAVAAVAAILLVLGLTTGGGGINGDVLLVLLPPIGLAGALLLAIRRLRGPSVTSRAVLLTPLVLFALGPFVLSFDAFQFVAGVYHAALYAGIGLILAGLVEARRSAWGPVGLALAVALLTRIGGTGLV